MTLAKAAADESQSHLQQAGVDRIANTQTRPPLSFLGDKNPPDGYDVAVPREIFRRNGVARIEFIAPKIKTFLAGTTARQYRFSVNSIGQT
ncbi:hypothetical protein BTM36_27165, partial [Herbaspirillum sp. VT-16-41]